MITETLPVLSITEPTEVEVLHKKIERLKQLSLGDENREKIENKKRELAKGFLEICKSQYGIPPMRLNEISDRDRQLLFSEILKKTRKDLDITTKANYFAVPSVIAGFLFLYSAFILGPTMVIAGVILVITGIAVGTIFDKESYGCRSLLSANKELKELGYWQENQDEKLLKLLKPATKTTEGGGR